MNNKTTNILLAVVFLVAAFFSFRYDQRPIGAFSVVMGVFFLYRALTNKEDVSKEKDYNKKYYRKLPLGSFLGIILV